MPTSQEPSGVAPSADQQVQPDAFRLMLKGIAVVCGLAHLAFLILFRWTGVDAMAAVNIGSVLYYLWMYRLVNQDRVGLAWSLAVVEVMTHATLAVWAIGWASGFHFYMLLVIPVAVLTEFRSLGLKVAIVALLTLTYVGTDMLLLDRAPIYVLDAHVVIGLHYFNVLGAILILIFLAGYYQYVIGQAQRNLREVASTDPLTQLRNRRAVTEAIRIEELRLRRAQAPMSFVLCDIDHFKAINDGHGHDVGDEVLRAVGRALSQGVRQIDHLARWGGEEFLLVLPGTTAQEAVQVADRLRRGVEALQLKAGQHVLAVRMTCGVSELRPGEPSDVAISRADQALYEGKAAGRNRVVAHGAAPAVVLRPAIHP